MRKTRHTITAVHPVRFLATSGGDDHETADVMMEITYWFHPGRPATGPSYASGGEPADPPEIELISVQFVEGSEISPRDDKQLHEWADDWMQGDDGYLECCRHAHDTPDEADDPDYRRDLMNEEF